MPKRYEGSE